MSENLVALIFLPFALPISIWVAWSDMATMKIPNKAVLALFAVFAVVGAALALGGVWDWSTYLWRYLHLVVILILGFVMNAAGLLGAGDAKFAAVMAPFVAIGDLAMFAYLFAASILVGFLVHRIAKRVSLVRRVTPNWQSWERDDFPMGLCLGTALVVYLAFAAAAGA